MNLEEDKIAEIYIFIYKDTVEENWLRKAIKNFKNVVYEDL